MLLEINFTLILFAASFLVFIYLLNMTLYKPVGEVIESRKQLMDGEYTKAKESLSQLLDLNPDNKFLTQLFGFTKYLLVKDIIERSTQQTIRIFNEHKSE